MLEAFQKSRMYFAARLIAISLLSMVPLGILAFEEVDGRVQIVLLVGGLVCCMLGFEYQTFRASYTSSGILVPFRGLFSWNSLDSVLTTSANTYIFKFKGPRGRKEVRVPLQQFKNPKAASDQLRAWAGDLADGPSG